jgi:ABC-type sugar transport system substrate-binding protein
MNNIIKMTRSVSAAMFVLAAAATPLAANAEEPVFPKYKQALACSGYYTVLHFYMDQKNPGTKQTLEYKGYAADWLKLAALLREPSDDLEKDFEAKQQDANNLIVDDSRASELKQVQTYCMTNGIARFKWDQK